MIGVQGVLLGLSTWTWPGLTVTVLVALFGASALEDGAFSVVAWIAS